MYKSVYRPTNNMRVISYKTYKKYAKRYNIPLRRSNGELKSLKLLSRQIYRFEKRNKGVTKGLYRM